MDKLKMHSTNFARENIAKLAVLFPGCVTESTDEEGNLKKAIDFDLLKQELSTTIVEGPQERYHLNWPGKREALLTANAPIAKTLRPCREESVDFDQTENLFIEGDNLDALKLLQETYLGKVKMIYIDPPYNTGSDLIYMDDFHEDAQEYLNKSCQVDDYGNRLIANTETNGRFHSDWLSMIYPRLKLSRNLLDDDGVICVSISDIELKNARSVMDEVFGENNYINTISVLAKVSAGASGGGEDKRLKKNIEYILIYAKSFLNFNTLSHLYTDQPLMQVIEEMRESGESWKYTSILLGADERVFFKTIEDGDGNPIDIYKRSRVRRSTINKAVQNERITEEDAYEKYFEGIFSDTNAQTSIRERVINAVGNLEQNEILEVEYVPRSGKEKGVKVCHSYISNTVRRVIWLKDVAEKTNDGIIKKEKLGTFWENFDYNNVGKEGEIPYPDGKKPIDLIRTCINLYNSSDGVFLDFFAGSGSLCHAVIRENALDGGHRKYIAVQIPEEIDPKNKKYQSAIKFYVQNNIPLVITEISKERIRRAGARIKAEGERRKAEENTKKEADLLTGSKTHPSSFIHHPLDIGFRVLKVDSSNMADVYYTPDAVEQNLLTLLTDNIKNDRSSEDLLFQVLLDWGVDLTLPISREIIKVKAEGGRRKEGNNTPNDSSFILHPSAFQEYEVFFVDGNALAACFAKSGQITEDFCKALAGRQPLRVVFRDSGFKDDSVKINVEQIFKLMSPHTDVKTI